MTTHIWGPTDADDDLLAAELARLLAAGPFAPALRAAIAARGLSLDRIQDRLARLGVPLSTATLSYWQSGRRRPERPASLTALRHLETILEVPPGALSALLPPPSPRARRACPAPPPELTALWPPRPAEDCLLSRIDPTVESALSRVSQHDRVQIGPDRRVSSATCRHVLRAEDDGADRWLLVFDWEEDTAPEPIVGNLRNCRLGRVTTDPRDSMFTAELLFDRPLRRGETHLIEYEVRNPHGGGAPVARADDSFIRRFRHPVREYVLEVCFDHAAQPARCNQQLWRVGDDAVERGQRLELGTSGSVHAVALDFGPGNFGVTWHW